jgi:NH3-dependent NAD+ synthetase
MANETSHSLEDLCKKLSEGFASSGKKKLLVDLSQGIYSAVYLYMSAQSTDASNIECVYLPGSHSSPNTHGLLVELSKKMGFGFKTLSLKFLESAAKNVLSQGYPSDKMDDSTSIQLEWELRAAVLYTRATQTDAMVVNSSRLLENLPKETIIELAKEINNKEPQTIPETLFET